MSAYDLKPGGFRLMMGPTDLLGPMLQGQNEAQAKKSTPIVPAKLDLLSRAFHNVRFTPKSGHWNSIEECPLCANSGH